MPSRRRKEAAVDPGWLRVHLGKERKDALEAAAKELGVTVKALTRLAVDEIIASHEKGRVNLVATG